MEEEKHSKDCNSGRGRHSLSTKVNPIFVVVSNLPQIGWLLGARSRVRRLPGAPMVPQAHSRVCYCSISQLSEESHVYIRNIGWLLHGKHTERRRWEVIGRGQYLTGVTRVNVLTGITSHSPQNIFLNADKTLYNVRKLIELPFCLSRSGRTSELKELLMDYIWLKGKLTSLSCAEVVEDFAAVLDLVPLNRWDIIIMA